MQQGRYGDLDQSELYFLVLHWLSYGPCRAAAAALLQEVEQHGLLPRTHSYTGSSHRTSYQQLLQQHSRLPHTWLPDLLQQSLQRVQNSGYAGAQGLSTLLAEGPLAVLPSLQPLPVQQQIPLWLRRPQKAPALPQQLLLREAGLHHSSSTGNGSRLPLRTVAARFCHHATFRGHGFPVFCVLFDKEGSRVITGADDAIVKIWSVQTGLLLVSCRGHSGEVSDLSISCDGQLLASGGNDGEIRVWRMKDANLGQNLAVLRGHSKPVHSIAFHPHLPTALLSASADNTVRLWDASDQHVAHLVLRPGRQAVWENNLPPAATASAHATDQVWAPEQPATAAAETGTAARDASRAPDAHAAAGEVVREGEEPSMICCAWSPCGTYIAAGNKDCIAYMWHWGVSTPTTSQHKHQQEDTSAQAAPAVEQAARTSVVRAVAGVDGPQLHVADWPLPVPLPSLQGHSQGVWQVEFNHAGTMLATGSTDGSVRVWGCARSSANAFDAVWQQVCLPLQLVRQPAAGTATVAPSPAPKQKQRKAQHEQEELAVDKVLWVADDSKLLAAGSDLSIRVWSTYDWSLQAQLRGHSEVVHVLSGHPLDPRLVLSAGHDGRSILWDAESGEELRRFSSSDTPPLSRGSWAPPIIQMLDGRFSPDGTSFVVSDVAGQLSVYALGPPMPLLLSAPYDQFFMHEYHAEAFALDSAGFAMLVNPDNRVVLAPWWQAARQFAVLRGASVLLPLADNLFSPYPDTFQAAYRAGRVLEYVKAGEGGMCLRGSSMTLPVGLEQWPPTVTAAAWKALEDRSAMEARGRSVPSEVSVKEAAERSAFEQHSRLLAALARGMTLEEEAVHVAQLQAAAAAARSQQQQQQQQQGSGSSRQERQLVGAGGHAQLQAAAGGAGAQARTAGGSSRLRRGLSDGFITEEEALQDLFDDRDNDVVIDSDDSDYSASGQQEGSSSEDLNGCGSDGAYSNGSGGSDGGYEGRRRRSQRRLARSRRQQAAAAGRGGSHNLRPRRRRGDSRQPEEEQEGIATRSRRHLRSAAAQGTPDRGLEQLQQLETRRRRHKRREWYSLTSEEEELSSGSDEERVQQQRRRTRRRLNPDAAAAAASDGGQRRMQRQRGQGQVDSAAAAAAAAAGDEEEAGQDPLQAWRTASKYSWLSSGQQLAGVYVPQLGDTVVYCWQGHKQYLRSHPELQQSRPWEGLQQPGPDWQQQQQQWQQSAPAWQQQQQWQQWHDQQQQWQQWGYDPGIVQQQQQQQQEQQPATAEGTSGAAHTVAQPSEAPGATPAEAEAGTGAPLMQSGAAAGADAAAAAATAAEAGMHHDREGTGAPTASAAVVAASAAASQAGSDTAAAAACGSGQAFQLRPAELCVIVGLDHVLLPGDFTAARLTLQPHDPAVMAAIAASAATVAAVAQRQPAAAAEAEATAAGSDTATADVAEPAAAAAAAAAGNDGAADDTAAAAAAAAATAAAAVAAAAVAAQGCFQVLLSSSQLGSSAQYVLLKSRFLASLANSWQVGNRVQAFHVDVDSEDGPHSRSRLGTVKAVDPGFLAASSDPMVDPYSCSNLWQCYQVQWDDRAGGDNSGADQGGALQNGTEADTSRQAAAAAAAVVPAYGGGSGDAGQQLAASQGDGAGSSTSSWCSPWELYPAELSADDAVAAEHVSGLTTEQVTQMLQTVEHLRRRKYKFFNAPPSPTARFHDKAQSRVRAYNRIIPLPLGLANIQARLEAGYYRSMQALLHDAQLVVHNAVTFNGPDSPFAGRAMEMYRALLEAAYPQQEQLQQQGEGWNAAAAGNSLQWQDAGVDSAAAAVAAAAAAAAGGDAAGQDWAVQYQMQAASGSDYQAQQNGWLQQQQQQGHAAGGQLRGSQQQAHQQGLEIEQHQQQPRGRIRLRMRRPGNGEQPAAGADVMMQRRSGRHQQQQQEQAPEPRSRRSAAQRARAFVADYAAVTKADDSASGSEGGSQEEDASDGSAGGRSRRRQPPVQPTRHSARLQRQHGGAVQYRKLAEGSDEEFESEGDG